jgi:uncharacterized protein YjbI with pentapeptide repeats
MPLSCPPCTIERETRAAALILLDHYNSRRLGRHWPSLRIDLRGANLSWADLYGAYLREANLAGANLAGVDLRSASLVDANLTGTDFKNTYLHDVDFSRTDLTGAKNIPAYIRHQHTEETESTVRPEGADRVD